MGGSSVLNYMLYIRGNKRDYDSWAAGGAYGWSWDEVFPYFLKSEDNRDPALAKNGKGTSGRRMDKIILILGVSLYREHTGEGPFPK